MFNFVRLEIHSSCGFHCIGYLSRILMCLRTESLAFVPGPQCLFLLNPTPISSQTKLVQEEYLKSGEHLGTMAIVSSFFFFFFGLPFSALSFRHCPPRVQMSSQTISPLQLKQPPFMLRHFLEHLQTTKTVQWDSAALLVLIIQYSALRAQTGPSVSQTHKNQH